MELTSITVLLNWSGLNWMDLENHILQKSSHLYFYSGHFYFATPTAIEPPRTNSDSSTFLAAIPIAWPLTCLCFKKGNGGILQGSMTWGRLYYFFGEWKDHLQSATPFNSRLTCSPILRFADEGDAFYFSHSPPFTTFHLLLSHGG